MSEKIITAPSLIDLDSSTMIRLDKWLWHARFFKTRTMATKICTSRRIRVDGILITKAHYRVRPGMVLTFPQAGHIRVVRLVMFGKRRGPASEARTLYQDLAPISVPQTVSHSTVSDIVASDITSTIFSTTKTFSENQNQNGQRKAGTGRPTKTERRALDQLHRIDQ